ncbi:MAG: hypothetical protein J5885_00710 [Clostridia bacterium]|nr:hypothetical protein [Clostridia bacterium]
MMEGKGKTTSPKGGGQGQRLGAEKQNPYPLYVGKKYFGKIFSRKEIFRMKKEYTSPKLQWFPIDFSDVLTLSHGGKGAANSGMKAEWDKEIYK